MVVNEVLVSSACALLLDCFVSLFIMLYLTELAVDLPVPDLYDEGATLKLLA